MIPRIWLTGTISSVMKSSLCISPQALVVQSFILVVSSLGSEATGMAFLKPTSWLASLVLIQITTLVSLIPMFSTQRQLTRSPVLRLPSLLIKVLLQPPLLQALPALHLFQLIHPSHRLLPSRNLARRSRLPLTLRVLTTPRLPLWQHPKCEAPPPPRRSPPDWLLRLPSPTPGPHHAKNGI